MNRLIERSGHAAKRIAMIGRYREAIRLFCGRPRFSQCWIAIFIAASTRAGAVGGIEDVARAFFEPGAELFRELDDRRTGTRSQNAMLEDIGLFLGRRHELGMAMP